MSGEQPPELRARATGEPDAASAHDEDLAATKANGTRALILSLQAGSNPQELSVAAVVDCRETEQSMVSASKSNQATAKEHRLSAIATDALKDLAILFQTELQLLRTEISEKLTLSGLSAALVAAGALMLAATIVLLLQAAIAALVTLNISLTMATLIVAMMTLILGAALVWVGIKGLGFSALVPKKTIKQLNEDATLAHIGES